KLPQCFPSGALDCGRFPVLMSPVLNCIGSFSARDTRSGRPGVFALVADRPEDFCGSRSQGATTMSHPCRRSSLVCWAFSGLLACAVGLRRWCFPDQAGTSPVEPEPRRRDLFRPSVDALERREGPTAWFGSAFLAPLLGDVSLVNLGG